MSSDTPQKFILNANNPQKFFKTKNQRLSAKKPCAEAFLFVRAPKNQNPLYAIQNLRPPKLQKSLSATQKPIFKFVALILYIFS